MVLRAAVLFNSKIRPEPIFEVTHHTALEYVWTLLPALILAAIGGPSFALLYALDEINEPDYTLKIVGNQWY
jgi:heme/copper-type cytochrome/quinol oxidase subunit 2